MKKKIGEKDFNSLWPSTLRKSKRLINGQVKKYPILCDIWEIQTKTTRKFWKMVIMESLSNSLFSHKSRKNSTDKQQLQNKTLDKKESAQTPKYKQVRTNHQDPQNLWSLYVRKHRLPLDLRKNQQAFTGKHSSQSEKELTPRRDLAQFDSSPLQKC